DVLVVEREQKRVAGVEAGVIETIGLGIGDDRALVLDDADAGGQAAGGEDATAVERGIADDDASGHGNSAESEDSGRRNGHRNRKVPPAVPTGPGRINASTGPTAT